MTSIRKPTSAEWESLYQAAIEFKRAACWEWMYDNDIFGVVDPETGKTAYCCIMGNGGEHFAVAGYLGAEGLDGILGLLSGEIDPEKSIRTAMTACSAKSASCVLIKTGQSWQLRI